MKNVHVIFASGSGHTEYVLEVVATLLKEKGVSLELQRAETAKPDDLLRGDVLLLASGTWNTGGAEGQLHPYMYAFLLMKAKETALAGKPVAVIALGDKRYRYTARAADHLMEFVKMHGGKLMEPILKIINEPYGQEDVIKKWAEQFAKTLS